jgi:hypothetical protein
MGGDFRCIPRERGPFGPPALLPVAHDRIDHIAPRASPAAKMPSVAAAQIQINEF